MLPVRSTWSLLALLVLVALHVIDTQARYHHIRLRHNRHRRQQGESYVPRTFALDNDEPERGSWGPWSHPTPCSRTCGGGVAIQTRDCLDRDDDDNERCTGARKRYFSCNIHPCPGEPKDFRAEQCAEFDNMPFNGVYYSWIPYTGGSNKCALNCMPRAERFFFRHKEAVIDGTPCNAEKNDVCVEGKCMLVGCDMMLGSDTKEDACRECGGNGSDCHTVRGLFDADNLKSGYNDFLLIPEGATNIVVREVQPSNNYLAVRNTSGHYYLNGKWRIDFPRSLRFAGTIFHYSRDTQQFLATNSITALGPTNESIYIVLLYQNDNYGVEYTYSIPKRFSQQSDPDSYTWVADEFSACSTTCGGGYQSRRVTCVKRRTNEEADEKLCDPILEPADTQACGGEPCPPQWVYSDWSPCSKNCGEGGEQTRDAKCEQIVSGGVPTIVDDNQCIKTLGSKNETKRPCNEELECPKFHIGPWKPCDHLCGEGKQTRKVTCFKKNDQGKIEVLEDSACDSEVPEREKTCELRPCEGVDWVVSPWSDCSNNCGLTQETRTVQCATQNGTRYPDDMCDLENKPELTRECDSSKDCEFQWIKTQWSKCSVECGTGIQTRKVFCATFESEDTMKKVPEDKCEASKKFNSTRECVSKAEDCKGEWFAGPWSQCSKPCGGGESTRRVVCLKDNMTVSSKQCDYKSIMEETESCNVQACEEDQMISVEPEKVTALMEEEDEECKEEDDEGFVSVSSRFNTDKFEQSTDLTEAPPLSSPVTSESNTYDTMDDMMFSDAAYSRGDISFPTDSGSGTGNDDETNLYPTITSLEEGSGTSPDNEATTFFTSETTSSEFEGSGTDETEFMESSSGVTGVSSDSSTEGMTDATTEQSTDHSSSDVSTDAIIDSSTAVTTDSITDISTGSTDVTIDSRTDVTIESSASTDSSSDASSISESSDSTIENTDTTPTSNTDTTPTSDTDTTSTSDTDTTPTSDTNTTPTSDTGTTPTSDIDTTETTLDSSSSTDSSTLASDVTETTANTEQSSETSVSSSDTVANTEGSTSEATEISGSTEATDSSGTTQTDASTFLTEETQTVETTESDATSESGSTEGSTETGATEETTVVETTESGTTVSEETEASSESSIIATTEEYTESSVSSVSEFDLTEQSHVTDIFTTISSVEKAITIENRFANKKCKSKKKKTCKKTQFGCCYDKITPAKGPFGFGCPTPHTCKDTTHGCCPDGVSPAEGPKFLGCPDQHCNETLFGCCQDGATPAEGNEFEGCKKPCNQTEFGCCPDKETPAAGNDNLGCCNTTKFGCCPDNIKPASSPNGQGCEEESIETTTVIPEDCVKTTHGCCPDGRKAANDTNFAGCDIINTKNCTASYFGCCPDNVTAALGPDNTGCRMACDNTTYGCCGDKKTPAHGPNREGCCLSSPYGCCPDNVLPARGPDFYGCGCQYSRFGCCPDNQTAARGSNNEGCGCQYTPHGCCPNRFTPATGPNYEGCPCYTHQFGCCPDGVTAVKGPHGQGCGCENTEFKCCSDERTPAKGSNFAGCACDSSKYGCCPDGIEEAQGEEFEGCRDKPSRPGMSCGFPRDRGTCRNFTVKWFYDTEYGGCSRFWYGGCEGNDNRFKTQEECTATCVSPKGKDICYLPKISGPCEGYNPTWYYDSERKRCGQFIYSGCLGNANRFKSREECEEHCGEVTDADPCTMPKEQGPCAGNFTRWFFNKENQNCEVFKYGGCKGNPNNYPSELACRQQCLQPGRSRVIQDVCGLDKEPGPCLGSLLRWYYDSIQQSCRKFIFGGCKGNGNKFRTKATCEQRCLERDSCSLPRTEGNCTNKYSRWYFDQQENRCMPFYYTGCGGNKNNFASRDACESDCPPKIEQDVCLLPALLGECHNYTQRWYFDSYEQRCRPFYYGGCGGNNNNFYSESECQNRCENPTVTPATPELEFQPEFCFLPEQRGPCTNYQNKWFYDSREGICKQFVYGGCSSNGNNFNSREECEYRCGEVQDPCTMPVLVGPCNGSVPQFYYDRRADACYEFDYSGCQGNKNRFNDLHTCERRCRKRPSEPEIQYTKHPLQQPPSSSSLSQTCLEPGDAGSCDGEITAYYFDSSRGKCQAFIYGGCEGNANRYETEEQCERLCGKFRDQDICYLPPDQGPCRGDFPKFYYDQRSRECREFTYGGCDGNANRFSSHNECESVCIHHEEPAQSGNKTALSDLTICKEPVDVGSCSTGNYKRFYYDDEYQTCRAFIYTGCGGNRNNFKTIDSCLKVCRQINTIPDDNQDTKDPCAEATEHCNQLHCPYGQQDFVDSQNCQRCRCAEPCQFVNCPEGTKCAVTLVGTSEGTEYRGVCNPISKPGRCPAVSSSTRCDVECYTDADCSGDQKCCNSGCGTSCLRPASENVNIVPPPYTQRQETIPPGAVPARIELPESPNVTAEEGGYVTLHCVVIGNPAPVIVWRKDSKNIGHNENRRRILPDGSLQIINLYLYDRGLYVCTADNRMGPPVTIEYQLEISEPHDNAPNIIDEPNRPTTVTLNSPTILHCYTIGWPRPTVTWWRNDSMLPLSSEHYEQESDNTLRIRSVTLTMLGIYTCHAFNGVGKPAEWSTVLQAIGPVANVRPDQEKYTQYLVQPPQRPEKPSYPYRPNRTQTHENQTYVPIPTTRRYDIPQVIPIKANQPLRVNATPVHVNVSTSQVQFAEGNPITMHCNATGHPPPQVTWYKNNIPLENDDRIRISESNELTISPANHNDSGTYRCEGINQYSSSAESVTIHVIGKYIDPNCQDKRHLANCTLIVAARYCHHQYYASFCCRSCTEAGQLPAQRPIQPYNGSQRTKRSIFSFL